MKRACRIFFLSLCLFSSLCFAQQINREPPKYPWHLSNYFWNCPAVNQDLSSLSFEFKVAGALTEKDGIYIAPLGLAHIGGIPLYGGIQTNTGGWRSKSERRIVKVGKGGIFSRWAEDNKTVSLDHADGDAQTLFEAAGYEGNFVSVRKKFSWDTTVYRYQLKRVGDIAPGQNSAWFAASVIDMQTAAVHEIGRLKFDGANLKLGKTLASFVEIYAGDGTSFPTMTVSFKPPVINGRACGSSFVNVVYPMNDQPRLVRYATTTLEGDWVTSVIDAKRIASEVRQERLVFRK